MILKLSIRLHPSSRIIPRRDSIPKIWEGPKAVLRIYLELLRNLEEFEERNCKEADGILEEIGKALECNMEWRELRPNLVDIGRNLEGT